MSPPPRSLTFAVSTSLLTASLSLAGCDEPKKHINPGPVNEAPKPEPDTRDVNPGPDVETPPEPDHVNVGPEPTPEPPPEPIHVNEGPEPPPPDTKVNPGPNDQKPTPEIVEPKRVNTRPDSP
jgi:hypothetical protein